MALTIPIWPDYDQNSKMSKIMLEAKHVTNDRSFWRIMRQILDNDIKTLPLEFFKVWVSLLLIPVISKDKNDSCISKVYEKIKNNELFYKALEEPMIGFNEEIYNKLFKFSDDINASMTRVHHMMHLIMSELDVEKLKSYDRIVELGAGSGDMADIIYKLGFSGEYLVYDFPELLKIQKWYHENLGYNNIKYIDSPSDLENSDLCIATFSLTEMPLDLRENILKNISKTKNWLICYSKNIFNYDNYGYIHNTLAQTIDKQIKTIDVPWMNWDGGTEYALIGDDFNL